MEPGSLQTPEELEKMFLPWPARNRPTDGQPMARVGIRLTLYFRRSGEADVRRALIGVARDYVRLARGRIRRYMLASDDRYRKVASGADPVLDPLLDHLGSDDFELEMSGAAAGIAEHWAMRFLAAVPGAPEQELGYLVAYSPLSAFSGAAPGSLRALFLRWCSALSVEHGYAGYGFVLPSDVGGEKAAMRAIGEEAMRFVGLDADLPSVTAYHCEEGTRCINWLTAVSTRLLARAGTAAQLAADAGPAITTQDYGYGTIFRAGDAPQIGDAAKGLVPAAYVALGSALRELRAAYPVAIFDAPDGFRALDGRDRNRAFTQTWLARFDR